MNFLPTSLKDVILIEPKVFGDARGFFMETYQEKDFAAAGISAHFVQDNHSGSKKGTLRGMHYQVCQTQGKLLRVVVGEIYDVAVDLRRSSPDFGKWVAVCLSAENKRMLWVPEGFAHGFYVLSDWVELLYKTTDYYAPQWERTLAWDDPQVGIEWPLAQDQPPLLSNKDALGSPLSEVEAFD